MANSPADDGWDHGAVATDPQWTRNSSTWKIWRRLLVIQQLSTAGIQTNPPTRGASLKQVTEGGAFTELMKYMGNPSVHCDGTSSARRSSHKSGRENCWTAAVRCREPSMRSRTAMCLSIEERWVSTVNLDWEHSEPHALLALKTSDVALASMVSLEEAEAKGIIGWQRLQREARGYDNPRVSHLNDSVPHPESVQKAADLQQAYYRWESNLKEFQQGRPTGLDDNVQANVMRHMMPKEILDAVNLQPQYLHLC